jgi:hypothetical protein
VLRDRYATREEKDSARRTRRAAVEGARGAAKARAEVRRDIDRAARRYGSGCLRKLWPAAISRALP